VIGPSDIRVCAMKLDRSISASRYSQLGWKGKYVFHNHRLCSFLGPHLLPPSRWLKSSLCQMPTFLCMALLSSAAAFHTPSIAPQGAPHGAAECEAIKLRFAESRVLSRHVTHRLGACLGNSLVVAVPPTPTLAAGAPHAGVVRRAAAMLVRGVLSILALLTAASRQARFEVRLPRQLHTRPLVHRWGVVSASILTAEMCDAAAPSQVHHARLHTQRLTLASESLAVVPLQPERVDLWLQQYERTRAMCTRPTLPPPESVTDFAVAPAEALSPLSARAPLPAVPLPAPLPAPPTSAPRSAAVKWQEQGLAGQAAADRKQRDIDNFHAMMQSHRLGGRQ
jgi:hypothetical protein